MMLKDKKIFYRLFGSFTLIILLVTGFGVAAINYLSSTTNITARLYQHPFTVATAVLKANASIISMHRSMKDVVLADDEASLQEAVMLVDSYEKDVYQSFEIIKERFLGNSAQIDHTLQTIAEWRPIRESVINLFRNGNRQQAIAITKGKGLLHLEKIMREMNALVAFAENKATEFTAQGLAKVDSAVQWLSGFLFLMFVLATLVAMQTTLGITLPLRRITAEMKLIADGGEGVGLVEVERKDELGDLAKAAEGFKKAVQDSKLLNADLQQQHWIRSNIEELIGKIQTSQSPDGLFDMILSFLVRLLAGGHGRFYLYDSDSQALTLVGTFGSEQHHGLSKTCKLGEGLVGQCALEKQPINLTEVPGGYLKISSGLGEATPLQITIFPVLYNEKLLGVIEIGAFHQLDEPKKLFLKNVLPALALNLENFLNSQKTSDLLQTTMEQAEELKTTDSELRASNEALREKAELLNIQSQELKTSEEEQKVINEELSEKNRMLDRQKAELQAASQVAEERARLLEQSNQYKSEFLANMSHELRTPLNSLLILSKSMANNEDGDLSADHVESAKIIYESGSDLLRLINDILDLSKIEAGKVDVLSESCFMAELTESLKRQFSHMADRKKIGLEINVQEGLPSEFITDANKLRQILSNLLSNAIKFTDTGKVTVSVTADSLHGADGLSDATQTPVLLFKVKDTGIGIPESCFDVIFEEFKQVDGTTSRSFGGTGLGLSIADKMAHLLGGEIRLTSTLNVGSEFTLVLPCLLPATNSGHNTTQKSVTEAAKFSLGDAVKWKTCSKAILIIEDDKRFAKTLGDAAQRLGFGYLHAEDGATGITLAETHQPRGILLDVRLPDMSGYRVIDKLRSKAAVRDIPIHIISAEDHVDPAHRDEVIGHLIKPVSTDQIDSTIRKLLSHSETSLKKLLVVEDDSGARAAIRQLIRQADLDISEASSAEEAMELLASNTFDCMILDLGLPGMNGYELLKSVKAASISMPPVVVYSGRELSTEESLLLREYTDSVIIKGAKASERLLDEVTLFLHSIKDNKDSIKDSIQAQVQTPSGEIEQTVFHDQTILIVDDDMRNIFALSKLLRAKGLRVLMAKDGTHALKQLDRESGIDLIVMDIMMPGMDGYETMRRIRKQAEFAALPIIAVTAKAMSGDRDKCIAAGANDYLPKPVAIDELIAKISHWIFREQ
jgi:CheY-like chemotaxis protein/GAF domain-containing protein